jgi:lyso-ornithine lipid O-acyltransferase
MLIMWTLTAMAVQSVCLLLPGRPKVWFAQVYWATFTRLLGMRVRVIGARTDTDRPVVFVANHCSWVDVPILGGLLPACFISKGEIANWPVVGTIARLGRTIFVSRQRGATGRELEQMRALLSRRDNLILFPEGTTSDGSRVMAFRTSFFAVAEGAQPPLVQPVSMAYDRLAGLPTGRLTRDLFAWYGDMDIASHYWRLAQHRGFRATVLMHRAIDPAHYPNRKALSQAVWQVVAEGAATLRQNRPAVPIGTEETPAEHEKTDVTAYA